jgi:hypothetical protein
MDLIDRMIRRLQHVEPSIDATRLADIERQLRLEFGGGVVRVRKKQGKKAVEDEVRKRWDGRSVAQIAQELQIHRSTAYRILGSFLRVRVDR